MKRTFLLASLCSLALAACAGDAREMADDDETTVSAAGAERPAGEGQATHESSLVLSAGQTFTVPPSPGGPGGPGDITTPGAPPVLDYELCCFGESCSVANGICAFSTWTCTTKKDNTYSGCSCTRHCG